jgi:hypothetical protein
VKVVRRALLYLRWNDAVFRHRAGWFFHRSEWLDYALAYTPGAVDHSFGVVDDDGKLLAIVPLIVHEGALVCGGQVTPQPLFFGSDAPARVAMEHARGCLGGRAPGPVQLRVGTVPPSEPPEGWRMSLGHTWVCDLTRTEAQQWADVRKSYRHLINKAERARVGVEAMRGDQDDCTTAMVLSRELHDEAAGRQTRSLQTWEMMARWSSEGLATWHVALTRAAEPAAYALVLHWKGYAYYASGASRLDNVQHLVQWRAMRDLRGQGVRQYELGLDAGPEASEKEQGVARFKGGFGGRRVPVLRLTPEERHDGDERRHVTDVDRGERGPERGPDRPHGGLVRGADVGAVGRA